MEEEAVEAVAEAEATTSEVATEEMTTAEEATEGAMDLREAEAAAAMILDVRGMIEEDPGAGRNVTIPLMPYQSVRY